MTVAAGKLSPQRPNTLMHGSRGLCLLVALFTVIITTGCASSTMVAPPHRDDTGGEMYRAESQLNTERPVPPVTTDLRADLISEVNKWQGTPYRLGGASSRGIDCSAFVQALYATVLSVDLPRTTKDQIRTGRPVRGAQIVPGDLVFFQTGRNQRHVGVALGGDEFAHAGTSSGVTVSAMNEPYWSARFLQARRVAPQASFATASTATPVEETEMIVELETEPTHDTERIRPPVERRVRPPVRTEPGGKRRGW